MLTRTENNGPHFSCMDHQLPQAIARLEEPLVWVSSLMCYGRRLSRADCRDVGSSKAKSRLSSTTTYKQLVSRACKTVEMNL